MNKCKLAEVIVFAGPNGSGKSSLTKLIKPLDIIYINADDIKLTGVDNIQHKKLNEAPDAFLISFKDIKNAFVPNIKPD